MREEDVHHEPTGQVIGAVALGVGPLPFLAVYSVLFIGHGFFYPTQPVDITNSDTGEGIAGILAALLFLVGVMTIYWLLNGNRRWPYVIGQLATFATALDFIIDKTKGSPGVPLMLAATSGIALVLSALPSTTGWIRLRRFQIKGNKGRKARKADQAAPSAPVVRERATSDIAV